MKPIKTILPMPGTNLFMIQTQYAKGGMIYTDDNQGKGYTEEEAQAKTFAQSIQDQ